MARNVRVVVFLNEEEMNVVRKTQGRNMSLSATLREAALDKLTWYRDKNKAYRSMTQPEWEQRLEHHGLSKDADGPQFIPHPQQ